MMAYLLSGLFVLFGISYHDAFIIATYLSIANLLLAMLVMITIDAILHIKPKYFLRTKLGYKVKIAFLSPFVYYFLANQQFDYLSCVLIVLHIAVLIYKPKNIDNQAQDMIEKFIKH